MSREGRRSLNSAYGPAGLGAIFHTPVEVCGAEQACLTLVVDQAKGRLAPR